MRKFAKEVKAIKGGKPLDALVCNAAVYLPAKSVPTFTPDGIEESLQINHLSHFLLVSLLLDDLKRAKDPRCVIVGSITVRCITGSVGWGDGCIRMHTRTDTDAIGAQPLISIGPSHTHDAG